MKLLIATLAALALAAVAAHAQLKTEITRGFGIDLGQVISPESDGVKEYSARGPDGLRLVIDPPNPVSVFSEFAVYILPKSHRVYWIHAGASACNARVSLQQALTAKYGPPSDINRDTFSVDWIWGDSRYREIRLTCNELFGLALNYKDLQLAAKIGVERFGTESF